GTEIAAKGPQVAMLGPRYAARWGDLILSGKFPGAPVLCDLATDASCAFNRREATPLASFAIFRGVVAADLAARPIAGPREAAAIDGDTAAALSVGGASE